MGQSVPQYERPSMSATSSAEEANDDFDPATFDLDDPSLLQLALLRARAVALHHGASAQSLPSEPDRLRAILLAQWVCLP